MLRFGVLGLGYIAKRHIEAIQELGHHISFAFDPSTTSNSEIPIFQDENLFFERLVQEQIDYVSICSPSYLHTKQAIRCMQAGASVIVEKPTCLTIQELDEIQAVEKETGQLVSTIFQLRYHPVNKRLQQAAQQENQIHLTYRGFRDNAYFQSWKGKMRESGGIVNTIGSHFFDLVINYFGSLQAIKTIEINNERRSKGVLLLKNAELNWDFEFSSVPIETQRLFLVNNQPIDFSSYQSNLHTKAYQEILANQGVSTEEVRKTVELIEQIHNFSA